MRPAETTCWENLVILSKNNCHHFFGKGFGYHGNFFGEICFNTSITGYQEILTDPSYFKQIITFTSLIPLMSDNPY